MTAPELLGSVDQVMLGRTLRGRGICYARGGTEILRGIDLDAEPGEVLALTGPSGSGKSSLLAVLALLEAADSGQVLLGEDELSPRTELRSQFGLVLQGYGLVSMLTAEENVELALQVQGVRPEQVRDRAADELARLGLPDLAGRLMDQLSGGQQQRVAVARALVGDPAVVLADEPTAALEATTRQLVLERLFAAARRGAVVVLATHDREVADQCDREVALHDGRVVAVDGVPVPGALPSPPAAVSVPARHREPQSSKGGGPAAVPVGPARLLEFADVGFARGGRQILAGVHGRARAGELLAVTGPSGSGKSSLLALLAGLDRPDEGAVRVDGRPVGDDPASRERYGLVLQGYGLMPVLTAAESVEIALQRLPLDKLTIRRRAVTWLERVQIADFADHLVDELSGGQQQRLAVARALVTEPEIVLADEPTAELDAETRDLVVGLLAEQAQRGAIVVLATHDPEVAARCARSLHLRDGRLADR